MIVFHCSSSNIFKHLEEEVVQEVLCNGVWLDRNHGTEEFVQKDHGPQEFLVSTKFSGNGASDLTEDTTDKWKSRHTGGSQPEGNNDGAFAGCGAAVDFEVETILGEEITGAVNGNSEEHDLGQVGHEVPIVTGTDFTGSKKTLDVEMQSAQVHDALKGQEFADVGGDQVPNVHTSFRDAVVDNVPEEDDHRHVCPETPGANGGAGKEISHHTTTKSSKDTANDIVGPVTTVGSDRVNQVKSDDEGLCPVGGIEGLGGTKDTKETANVAVFGKGSKVSNV